MRLDECFAALGLTGNEDARVIKDTYRKLVQENFPRTGGDETRIREIIEAYKQIAQHLVFPPDAELSSFEKELSTYGLQTKIKVLEDKIRELRSQWEELDPTPRANDFADLIESQVINLLKYGDPVTLLLTKAEQDDKGDCTSEMILDIEAQDDPPSMIHVVFKRSANTDDLETTVSIGEWTGDYDSQIFYSLPHDVGIKVVPEIEFSRNVLITTCLYTLLESRDISLDRFMKADSVCKAKGLVVRLNEIEPQIKLSILETEYKELEKLIKGRTSEIKVFEKLFPNRTKLLGTSEEQC